MKCFADLAEQARGVVKGGNKGGLNSIINANFNKRCEITLISQPNTKMVETARSAGATAKFTGSGGAIVGTYKDEAMFKTLVEKLTPLNIEVIRPEII
jgi:glucuronokinase